MNYEELYQLLQTRATPETVAKVLLENLTDLTPKERGVLAPAAARGGRWSSMHDDFHQPESFITDQMDLLPTLFGTGHVMLHEIPSTVETLRTSLGFGPSGMKTRRMTKVERREHGIFKNARWLNKRRKLLDTLERKLVNLGRSEEMYLFTRVSKSALAIEIPYELFTYDENTAALVTYLVARMNRRSVFTNEAQDRAYDKISSVLMARCRESDNTQWFVISHVLPDAEVLEHLTDDEKGFLVGRWYFLLEKMAERMREVWSPEYNRLNMIVHKGNDSSTWNVVAGAWNRAREHWVSLTYALSGTTILDVVCPGKVMRLMAADVAYWHKVSGGELHPDTRAWAALPFPWDVLSGIATCGLDDIRRVCEDVGASFETWTFRQGREVVAFKPTPELVHGVEVTSPELALMLRKAGVFSGQRLKGEIPEATVIYDEHGMVVLATDDPG